MNKDCMQSEKSNKKLFFIGFLLKMKMFNSFVMVFYWLVTLTIWIIILSIKVF